jgi:hypothetical protein
VAKEKTQADSRRSIIAKDQFGRPWLMQIDINTGSPTGGVIASGWTDPLRTPLRFIEVPKDEYNQPLWGRCKINIYKWMQAISAADQEWLKRLNECGVHQYKNKFDPKKAHMDSYLLEMAGPRPWPSKECLEALRTGNRHLQGQVVDEDGLAQLDEEAKELMSYTNIDLNPAALDEDEYNMVQARRDARPAGLPDDPEATMAEEETPLITGTTKEDYAAFAKMGRKAGLNQAQISVGWAEHKQLVAEATAETA